MMTLSQSRILLVEDESDIRELIRLRLEREGYHVTEAGDGEEALKLIQDPSSPGYDLFVLDWMLPRMSGLEITRILRGLKAGGSSEAFLAPILMVTARIEAADVVLGLEAGADDYVTKPFEIPVLLARVRALLRRSVKAEKMPTSVVSSKSVSASGSETHLIAGSLNINLDGHEVHCAGERIQLTPSEFKLLVALMKNEGRVLTRQKLIDLVQGVGVSVVDRAVDTHVFGLRKKLGTCGDLIETIRGVGYRVKSP